MALRPPWFDHLWSALTHATIAAAVWHRGLLGVFLKQRLSVSDYATRPFDFHKLFTLQKTWQRLLSCAKVFTYVVCLKNAAAVIAIILQKRREGERAREAKTDGSTQGLSFSVFLCCFHLVWQKWMDKKTKNGTSIEFPYSKRNSANLLLHSYAKASFFLLRYL